MDTATTPPPRPVDVPDPAEATDAHPNADRSPAGALCGAPGRCEGCGAHARRLGAARLCPACLAFAVEGNAVQTMEPSERAQREQARRRARRRARALSTQWRRP